MQKTSSEEVLPRKKSKLARSLAWIPDKLKEIGVAEDEISNLTEERLTEIIVDNYKVGMLHQSRSKLIFDNPSATLEENSVPRI